MSDIPEFPAETPEPQAQASASPAAPKRKRGKVFALMLALPVVLAAGAGGWWLMSGGQEVTDNANLHQARIAVAPTVGGRVTKVGVSELQHVKKGDLLFQVDDEPYRLALAQTEASAAAARLKVEQLKAAWRQAEAQADLAAEDARFQASELTRQEALTGRGVSSTSDRDSARHLARQTEDASVVAAMNVQAARAALGGDPQAPTDAHPSVRAALADLDRAAYNLSVTKVLAPSDGVIYQAASFREGAMVSAGQSVFALVDTQHAWVEANFKETQLAGIGVGMTAEVTFDMAPGRQFSGTVEAIGAGTGAEFSLLPAQNATGNWVKVTQRVPVRIRLDHPEQAAALASGLSAEVAVDTGSTGQPLMAAMAAE